MLTLKRLQTMLGFGHKEDRPNKDPLAAQIIVARERNQRASDNARNALQCILSDDNHMAITVNQIVGKMK